MSDRKEWRAGFEVEVILGHLDDLQFFEDLREPMDVASLRYCRALARELRDYTGRRWLASENSPRRTGFFVIPEYDLDPLHWPYGRIAGVELLTPPLPLSQAQEVRDELKAAIHELDGPFNFRRSDHTDGCAWHVNIDAGDRLDAQKFALAVDELPILAANHRLFSRYAAPQRHAYGVELLRHISTDPGLGLLKCSGLSNLLRHYAGKGKRYAANFAKTDLGYLELRHFSALTFFTGPPLDQLLEPITRALDMWAMDEDPFEQALLRRFTILHQWLGGFRDRLTWTEAPADWMTTWHGEVYLDGRKIGEFDWNGSLEMHLTTNRRYRYNGTFYEVAWPDIPEAVALMAIDYAELTLAGVRLAKSSSTKFQRLLSDLITSFRENPDLYAPPPPVRH